MLRQDTPWPGGTTHLCEALPAEDCDFPASLSVSPSEVSSEVTRWKRVIPDLERLQWVAAK